MGRDQVGVDRDIRDHICAGHIVSLSIASKIAVVIWFAATAASNVAASALERGRGRSRTRRRAGGLTQEQARRRRAAQAQKRDRYGRFH